jgi:CrcB protein
MRAHYLWVGLGGGLGTMARYACSGCAARWFGEVFPWGTLLVNVGGSFLIGLAATLTGPEGRLWVAPEGREFFLFGFCGGFTTFSSFSLQTLNLINDGEWPAAAGNIAGSVALCLSAVWLGATLGMWFNAARTS